VQGKRVNDSSVCFCQVVRDVTPRLWGRQALESKQTLMHRNQMSVLASDESVDVDPTHFQRPGSKSPIQARAAEGLSLLRRMQAPPAHEPHPIGNERRYASQDVWGGWLMIACREGNRTWFTAPNLASRTTFAASIQLWGCLLFLFLPLEASSGKVWADYRAIILQIES